MTILSKTALAVLTAGTIAFTSLTPASAGPISPVAAGPSAAVLNQAASEANTAPLVDVHWKKGKWHSHARHNRRAAAAGIAGALIGAAIVGAAASRERRRESRYDRHVRRCYNAYRSYDEETDTWIDRRGRVRRCRL